MLEFVVHGRAGLLVHGRAGFLVHGRARLFVHDRAREFAHGRAVLVKHGCARLIMHGRARLLCTVVQDWHARSCEVGVARSCGHNGQLCCFAEHRHQLR